MNRPLPFAWISCVGEKGGAETLMIECLRALDRSQFEPHVIQLRPGPLEALLGEIDVRVHVLRHHRMREVHRIVEAIGQIRALTHRHGLRLLHSNGFRAHVYGGLAALWAGVPEVWTGHTFEQPGWSTRAILAIPTRHVLANCPRTADFYRPRVTAPVDVVWPGVNIAVLEKGTPRPALAAKFNLPATARWVSMGARLQRYKGQIEFLHAIAATATHDIHGIIIGGSLFGQESDYERELKSLAMRLGIADRVTFTGFIADADVAGLLAASYVTIHPAHEEDFGLSVAEAQALGVPTIAFAAVGPAAIIIDGETGWLAPIGDQALLNRFLGNALADPAETRRRGFRAKEECLRRFGVGEHVRRTVEAYRSALESSG